MSYSMRNMAISVTWAIIIGGCTEEISQTPLGTSTVTAAMADSEYQREHYGCHEGVTPDLDLDVLEDLNPDPGIVEVALTAEVTDVELISGMTTNMWTYNGVVPGPMIQGDVGDTLIVHFTNHLPDPTTIHWHGVEVPAAMDGSNISQVLVPPGGYFRYEFKLLNPATHWYHPHFQTDRQIERGLAGPLIIRDPQEFALLEIPSHRDRTFVLDDILLVLDESDPDYGEIYDFPHDPGFLNNHTPTERAQLIINGRETPENILLVNGKGVIDPDADPEDLPTVYVQDGVPERWRFINVANGRFMRVSIPGQTLYQIGGDGGLLEHPVARPPIDLIPDPEDPGSLISNPDPSLGVLFSVSERAEVVFVPEGGSCEVMYLEWHDFPRGRHAVVAPGDALPDGTICGPDPCLTDLEVDGRMPPKRILRIVVEPKPFHGDPYEPPADLRDIVDIRGEVDLNDLAQALPVTFGHTQPNASGLITFFAAVRDRDDLLADVHAQAGPVMPPMYAPAPFPAVLADPVDLALWTDVGDIRYWEVINFTAADHPMHTHGFFFQPIEVEYVDLVNPGNNRVEPWPYLELKDTIRSPRRPAGMGTSWTITRSATRISDSDRPPHLQRDPADLVAFGGDPSVRPGGWVDHCHIDEHADAGMMTFLNVVPAP